LLLIFFLLTSIDRCLVTRINNNSLLNLSIELTCEYCAGGDGPEEPGLQSHPDGGQTPQTAPGSKHYRVGSKAVPKWLPQKEYLKTFNFLIVLIGGPDILNGGLAQCLGSIRILYF
jgi:hypothetical protein